MKHEKAVLGRTTSINIHSHSARHLLCSTEKKKKKKKEKVKQVWNNLRVSYFSFSCLDYVEFLVKIIWNVPKILKYLKLFFLSA